MLYTLILCGGKSTRMGSDKGLLLYQNCTWTQHLINSLSVFCDEIYISINTNQMESYATCFSENVLIMDTENDRGPLGGIISAHQKYADADWLIIPCDMFDFEKKNIELLINSYKEFHKDAFYYFVNQQIETFPCILKSDFLKSLYATKLENWSLQKHLKNSNNYQIEINNPSFTFKNYNSENDF